MKSLKYIFSIVPILIFAGAVFASAQTGEKRASAPTVEQTQVAQAEQAKAAPAASEQAKTAAAQASKPLPANLTKEEIDHLVLQKNIDASAVQNANSIRSVLRSALRAIRGFSTATADALEADLFGILVIQYLAAIFVLLITYFLVKYVFGFVFKRLAALSGGDENGFAKVFLENVRMPLDVFAIVLGIYFALVFTVSDEAAVAMLSRAIGIVFWCAVFWLVIIISDSVFGAVANKLGQRSAKSTANLVSFARRVVKVILLLIAVLSVLTNCGVNVNSIMASLGIGGVALAFASQDTIANFFGSVSIIIDRPFIVGDLVKTSSAEGTVDAIGFRSTRIRTANKTVITIPNSVLAKDSVENFSKRNTRKVVQTIGLTYSTTADQMESIMADLRASISEIEGVSRRDGVSAEFCDFADSSLNVEIIYYTSKTDRAFYMATRRKVNLAIMRIVEKHRLSFAFPSTSLYIESDATKK